MTILLYVDQQTHTFQTVFWIIGFLLASLLIYSIFWQYRKGHELEEELEQLGKQKKKDIELDFVLKAMGLSTWHINTESGQLFFDKDFREKRSETVTGKDGDSFGENATLLVEEDSERVTNHLAALCSGRTEEYHEQYRVRVPHSSKTYW